MFDKSLLLSKLVHAALPGPPPERLALEIKQEAEQAP
jgi:hypothetical protein